MRFNLTSKHLALGICSYFVILAVCYASVTPAFEAPDESAHFLYIHNLLEAHRLPILESRDIVFNSQSTQRHHPPLYYLIGSALIAGTRRSDLPDYLQVNPFAAVGVVSPNNQNAFLHRLDYTGDTANAVWILRLYSITLATLTLWFIYSAGRLALGRDSVGLLAMLLVACTPSFMFIGASINNDNLVTLFYAVGVYRCLWMWKQRKISNIDILILGLVLAGAALSKLTGLALFAVVYLSVLMGVYKRRYPWQRAARLIIGTLLIGAVLAGWWYLRNLILYGDPLALRATLAIWSRGQGNTPSLGEFIGAWESFWMILGNFNVRGPDWLYIYTTLITLIGSVGIILAYRRHVVWRSNLVLLLLTCFLVIAGFVTATTQINISQGRILYPALVGYAPLIVGGWYAILGQRISRLLIVPLAVVEIMTPAYYLPTAYARLDIVKSLPTEVHALSVNAGGLHILGYQLDTDTVAPGDTVRLQVYFAGRDAANPYLFVKAIDPDTNSATAGVDLYPGMAPTSDLLPEQADIIYRTPVAFRLPSTQPPHPIRLNLAIGWNSAQGFLPLFEAGKPLNTLIVSGPTLIDLAQRPPMPVITTDIRYADEIHLSGYTLSPDKLAPGNTLTLTLVWQCLKRIDRDLTAAVGILDANNKIVVQADGVPDGYPTSAWRPGPGFADTRKLMLPVDLAPGAYTLYIGWYNLANGERLLAYGQGTAQPLNLAEIPITIQR